MRTHRLGVVFCSALAAATFGLTASASADSLTAKDDRRDVLHFVVADGEPRWPGATLPGRRNGDLKGYTVRYGPKQISATFRFRELKRTGPVIMVDARFLYLQGGQYEYRNVVLTARTGNWQGRARTTMRGCAVLHDFDYRKNTVRLSFSSRCFATPRWIQLNAQVIFSDRLANPSYLFADDIYPVFSENNTAVERFSPRIRRS